MEAVINWIKANKTIAYIGAGVLAVFFLLPMLKGKRKRKRRVFKPVIRVRSKRKTVNRRSTVGKTTGKQKPAWMVKGSPAAKARMARLRKMRG